MVVRPNAKLTRGVASLCENVATRRAVGYSDC